MQSTPPTKLINLNMIRNRSRTNSTKLDAKHSDTKGSPSAPSETQRIMSQPGKQQEQHEQAQKQQPFQSDQSQSHHHHHHHHGNSQSNFIGHYELKETLGKGNFSTVKLAQHKITNHSVAIKIVKHSVLSDDNLMKINREIDVLKKLGRHNHIVRLYQVIKTKRYFFLVTEFCANGELYDYLVTKGRLNETQSCKYFKQILSAVEYLHNHNIVHRDLKAENLLLTDNYETVKLADFGFANYYKPDNPLSTWCGSPPYAAPELFNGLLYIGPPVDIWSMGVILYVLVCGSLPFDGQNLVHLKSRVTSGKFRIPFFMTTECEGLIRGMLRLDPERRFSMRQIKAHCWTQKYSMSQQKDSPKGSRHEIGNGLGMNNNRSPKKGITGNRGQSLDSDEDKLMQTLDLQPNTDCSMSSLNNNMNNINRLRGHDLETCSKITPASIRNLVDTEIVDAVSNMSIDSEHSSLSQAMDITNATFSNQSGCVSSLSSSRYSGTPRADSAGQNNNHVRQFSKESSIDDQIIDFMVDNLKVADNHTSIRQSIANDKYDDLHAIYRLLKDQPDMVLEAKFKIPSLPLISPSRDESNKKPSITTGFFNFSQINAYPGQTKPELAKIGFSGDNNHLEPVRQATAVEIDRPNVINLSHVEQTCDTNSLSEQSQEQAWKVPPQLFLTPPIDGRAKLTKEAEESTDCQVASAAARSDAARHSFDSAISSGSNGNINNRPDESSPSRSLTRDSLWCSSMFDSQGVSMTPTTPVKLGDSFVSTGFPETQGVQDESARLVQNLATITTNLPQIGAFINAPNMINHNLLLAQLNSAACNAVMTQSGLLAQHEPIEQRLQQTLPLKFTPNNLVNQNYNVINDLTLQANLKLPGIPKLSLLDPDSLISGLERRASDGQASYSSLTTNTEPDRAQQKQHESSANTRPQEMMADSMYSSSSKQIFTTTMNNHHASQAGGSVHDNALANLIDLSGISQFNDHSQHSANVCHRNSDGFVTEAATNDLNQSCGPLDLSNKLPTTSMRSCYVETTKRDGLKRISNQRSNSTTSETAVCVQNLPNSATTSPRIFATGVTNNNGIPFCHTSKRAKKLHQ